MTKYESCNGTLQTVTEIQCGIKDCVTSPEYRLTGYLHFKHDGMEYCQDTILLCEEHTYGVRTAITQRESRVE